MEDRQSKQIIEQRIRNRLIEYLEVVSSFDEQREYQAHAPVSVPNEMINQWEDWVQIPTPAAFSTPVFSPEERDALLHFHAVWEEVADSTPNPLPPLDLSGNVFVWPGKRR